VDLGNVLRDATLLLRHLLPDSIVLDVNIPAESRLSIEADPIQLQQVLINLTLNARDAMPRGGRIRIDLASRAEDDSPAAAPGAEARGLTACLEVRDDGVGMSDEVKTRIFEPFFTTKPHERGTGLGLPIVRSILQKHGGRVEIESAPGAGTTFRVLLPGATLTPAEEALSEL
jgi:signal transduction histidine kinase